jgi:hypothetical protein
MSLAHAAFIYKNTTQQNNIICMAVISVNLWYNTPTQNLRTVNVNTINLCSCYLLLSTWGLRLHARNGFFNVSHLSYFVTGQMLGESCGVFIWHRTNGGTANETFAKFQKVEFCTIPEAEGKMRCFMFCAVAGLITVTWGGWNQQRNSYISCNCSS